MSGIQRFITRVVPRQWATDMETESRQWVYTCPNCAHTRSVWDMGGIRWKASGNPSRLMACPECGQRGMHKLTKQA
jgi:DNA-directed RNA polymerase subunit RPC12/RpoP